MSIEMVGDVVGGYVVKQLLASGQNGLLYLAVNEATGQRAVVQRRLAEDDLKAFAREAAQVLEVADCQLVERRKSRGGVAVLLAIIDPTAPGLGYTQHTDTQQVLPRLGSRRSSRKGLMALGLALLLLIGAAAGAWLVAKPALPAPVPVQVAKVERVEPAPPTVAAIAPVPTPPLEPEPEPVKSAPDAPLVTAKPQPAVQPPTCTPDAQWKRQASADLTELMERAAHHELLQSAADDEEAISQGIGLARNGAECRAVAARLRRLHERVLAAEASK